MADTNARIVREFLEAHNFTVITNRKFQLQKADPPGRYSIEILAKNMRYTESEDSLPMRLQPSHMRFIPNAIVDVKGWHTNRFSPSLLNSAPDLFYFVSPEPLAFAREMFGEAPFKSILVISELAVTQDVWPEMEEKFREKGIDHVIDFPTILGFLISHVEVSHNYIESDTLQMLRLLKRYNLVKGLQMELPFKGRSASEGKE